jgi:hypothetical protein
MQGERLERRAAALWTDGGRNTLRLKTNRKMIGWARPRRRLEGAKLGLAARHCMALIPMRTAGTAWAGLLADKKEKARLTPAGGPCLRSGAGASRVRAALLLVQAKADSTLLWQTTPGIGDHNKRHDN